MSEPSNTKYAFKWVIRNQHNELRTPFADAEVVTGKWLRVEGELVECANGFHFPCAMAKYYEEFNARTGCYDEHYHQPKYLTGLFDWRPNPPFNLPVELWMIEVDMDGYVEFFDHYDDNDGKAVAEAIRYVLPVIVTDRETSRKTIRDAVSRTRKKYGKDNFCV